MGELVNASLYVAGLYIRANKLSEDALADFGETTGTTKVTANKQLIKDARKLALCFMFDAPFDKYRSVDTANNMAINLWRFRADNLCPSSISYASTTTTNNTSYFATSV